MVNYCSVDFFFCERFFRLHEPHRTSSHQIYQMTSVEDKDDEFALDKRLDLRQGCPNGVSVEWGELTNRSRERSPIDLVQREFLCRAIALSGLSGMQFSARP
jgi:hypothetical protein